MAGAGDFIFVTAIEYTTVHPSAPALTQLTTLATPSPSMAQSSTALGSFSETYIVASLSGLIPSILMPTSTSIATHASSMTSFSALLTSFEKPSSQFQPKGYNNGNNKVPELALTAVILMTVTLLTFLGYAIFQRCRGKCEYCAAYKDETYALNARNSQSDAQNFQAYASTNAEPDLEKGVTLVDEREKERAATLTALESNSRFKYLWSRAKVRIAVSPVESASATRPPTAQSFNSALERPFPCVSGALEPSLRPASSIYSCAADSNAGRNNYAEHYESTGPIILHAYTTASSNVGRAFSEYIRKDFGPT